MSSCGLCSFVPRPGCNLHPKSYLSDCMWCILDGHFGKHVFVLQYIHISQTPSHERWIVLCCNNRATQDKHAGFQECWLPKNGLEIHKDYDRCNLCHFFHMFCYKNMPSLSTRVSILQYLKSQWSHRSECLLFVEFLRLIRWPRDLKCSAT